MGWTLNIFLKAVLLAYSVVVVYQFHGGAQPLTAGTIHSVAVVAGVFAFLVRPMFYRRLVPNRIPSDILQAFDAGGLSLASRFEADAAIARLKVYFQNCHTRACAVECRFAASHGHV